MSTGVLREGVGLLAAGITGNRGTPSVGTGTRTTIPTNRKLATPLITFGRCFEVTFFSRLIFDSVHAYKQNFCLIFFTLAWWLTPLIPALERQRQEDL